MHTAEEWHAWVSSVKKASSKCPCTKKPRHGFARTYAEKDENYWDSKLWSDETKITVIGTGEFKTVWHCKSEVFKEKCMVPTVKPGGASAAGVRELDLIDGTMN